MQYENVYYKDKLLWSMNLTTVYAAYITEHDVLLSTVILLLELLNMESVVIFPAEENCMFVCTNSETLGLRFVKL